MTGGVGRGDDRGAGVPAHGVSPPATIAANRASHRYVSSSFAIDIPDSLIAATRAGDVGAFERIYRLFERPAYTLALRLLVDPDDAREVLHDALLGAFDRIGQYRGDSPFWAWLRQIVTNTALMRLRKRRRVDANEVDWPHEDFAPVDTAISPVLAAETAALEQALARLPDVTRSVIWLYCVEGYSHAEIAGFMSQTTSFSKSQLSRGLGRLRVLLDAKEVSHA